MRCLCVRVRGVASVHKGSAKVVDNRQMRSSQ